jgi:preprotein translocase subunit SecD
MYKGLWWKAPLIGFFILLSVSIFVSVAYLYPLSQRLKQEDRIGGTRVYEIDSSDLAPAERRDLAERMIPILLKRIDLTHVANIMVRPQGDTRIKIQVPVDNLNKPENLKREPKESDAMKFRILPDVGALPACPLEVPISVTTIGPAIGNDVSEDKKNL